MQNNSLLFSLRDVYPNLGAVETSTAVNPEADDQEALNQNPEEAQQAGRNASKRNVFLAIGVIIALIIFLGVD